MASLSLPVRLAFGVGQLAEAVKNAGFNKDSGKKMAWDIYHHFKKHHNMLSW